MYVKLNGATKKTDRKSTGCKCLSEQFEIFVICNRIILKNSFFVRFSTNQSKVDNPIDG